MFKTLFLHELQNYLYSLRFQISFIIVMLVFAFGTVSYIISIKNTQDNYTKLMQEQRKTLESRANNASRVATEKTQYYTNPRNSAVIDDCKESVLPNTFTYSAYYVYGFDVRKDSVNPLLKKVQGLNWSFIMSMILSFITLLFTFDSISGEKEDRTLSLVFSNKVSRGKFILSKFLSTVTIVFIITITGIIVSLLIIMLSGKVIVDIAFIKETAGFLLISFLFISVMAIIGLLASTLSKYSNTSLLTCLTIWIFIAVVIPNSSLFFANKLFGIPPASEVERIIEAEQDDIYKNAPSGSMSYYGNDPFNPVHKLRAELHVKIKDAEKSHNYAYYNQMFNQFEKTRMLSIFSPMSQFNILNEGILSGGYLRFKKNWGDLNIFQGIFLQWFKNFDAKDPESPHWYNPIEDISTTILPVEIDQIPTYSEKKASMHERLNYMRTSIIAIIVILGLLFSICFIRFLRYDVR